MKVPWKYLLIVMTGFIFFHSCQETPNSSLTVPKSIDKDFELSHSSLVEFQKMLKDYQVNGDKFNFIEGHYLANPHFDSNFVKVEDLQNSLFFMLIDSTKELMVEVNCNDCYASIPQLLNSNYYPNQSVIFPYDFSFLKKEGFNINCERRDSSAFREVSFDKNMLGCWMLDSMDIVRRNYEADFLFNKLCIEKNLVVLNDSLEITYQHHAYYFDIDNSNYKFYKIFIGQKWMILINRFNDSYEEYFFRK